MRPESGCCWCAKTPRFVVCYQDAHLGDKQYYFCTDVAESACVQIGLSRLRRLTRDSNFLPNFIPLGDEKGEKGRDSGESLGVGHDT